MVTQGRSDLKMGVGIGQSKNHVRTLSRGARLHLVPEHLSSTLWSYHKIPVKIRLELQTWCRWIRDLNNLYKEVLPHRMQG